MKTSKWDMAEALDSKEGILAHLSYFPEFAGLYSEHLYSEPLTKGPA